MVEIWLTLNRTMMLVVVKRVRVRVRYFCEYH